MTSPSSYIRGVHIFPLKKVCDGRGWLMELFRQDELLPEHMPVMAYVSQTEPGVTRGPHEHSDQTDVFCFMGPGDFELHLWEQVQNRGIGVVVPDPYHESFVVGESNPVMVVVPPGVVHAYKNISDKPGWVWNAPNRLYGGPGKKYPVDETRHEHQPSSRYKMQ